MYFVRHAPIRWCTTPLSKLTSMVLLLFKWDERYLPRTFFKLDAESSITSHIVPFFPSFLSFSRQLPPQLCFKALSRIHFKPDHFFHRFYMMSIYWLSFPHQRPMKPQTWYNQLLAREKHGTWLHWSLIANSWKFNSSTIVISVKTYILGQPSYNAIVFVSFDEAIWANWRQEGIPKV